MSAVATIERVLGSALLRPTLISVPATGATEGQIARVESRLPRSLSQPHRTLLARWNGLDLDVLRIHGADSSGIDGPRDLASRQDAAALPRSIVFADDPSGFVYVEDELGVIWSMDSDGGEAKQVAPDLDAFFSDLVFGRHAAKFMGQSWADELMAAGLLDT